MQHCIDILVYNMNTNRLVNSLYFTLGHQFLFLIFPSQSQDPQCFRISEENEGSWQVAGTSVKRNQKVPASGSLVFFALSFSCPSTCKIFCSLPQFSPTFCWSRVAPLLLHPLWYPQPCKHCFLLSLWMMTQWLQSALPWWQSSSLLLVWSLLLDTIEMKI